ncbi:moesin/ezrin/radixin homolog 1-like [Ciona intestinalis]
MPLSLLKKKKRGKLLSVQISTLDAELNFSVDSSAKAKNVFDLICHTIGLRETWYFGLAYTGKNGSPVWLKLDKRILDQNVPRSSEDGSVELRFLAKFYPEVLDVELIQEVTRHLFYLQFQQLILSEELTCSPEAAILLASFAVQAKFGDYDEEIHKPGFLANEVLLPQQVRDQFQSVTGEMWETQITSWYAQHHGLTRDEAELEYLKIVQEFEMSGVQYFKIKDGNGADLWLGIDAKSVSMYPYNDQLHPTKSYQWSELADMSYYGNKFVIKQTIRPTNTNTIGRRFNLGASTSNLNVNAPEDIVFLVDDPEVNKLILDLCRGNHDLFMQRRRVDTMEIQQMKEQAREEKARKQMERTRLTKEKNLRLQVQNEKKELEEKLAQFQEENRSAADTLRRSEETAELLGEKAKVAEEEAQLLRAKLNNSDQEIQSLKLEIGKLQEANHQLPQKFLKYEQYVSQLNEQAQARAGELKNVCEELYATKAALNDANIKLNLLANQHIHHSPNTSNSVPMNMGFLPINNQIHSQVISMPGINLNNTSQSNHSPAVSNAQYYHMYAASNGSAHSVKTDGSNVTDRNSNEFTSAPGNSDMQQLSQEIEKERMEYHVKSRNIEQQLFNLRSEIEVLKVDESMTGFDQKQDSNQPHTHEIPGFQAHQETPQYYDGL